MYTKELKKSKITSIYIYGDIIGIIVPGVKFIWKMSFTLEEINEKNYQFHKYYLQNSKTNLTSSFQPASLIFKNCHLLPLTFDTWQCYFKEKRKTTAKQNMCFLCATIYWYKLGFCYFKTKTVIRY